MGISLLTWNENGAPKMTYKITINFWQDSATYDQFLDLGIDSTFRKILLASDQASWWGKKGKNRRTQRVERGSMEEGRAEAIPLFLLFHISPNRLLPFPQNREPVLRLHSVSKFQVNADKML